MQLEKLTKTRQSRRQTRYDDACGTAHALDLIGERWALLVLRELMLGPRRFSELEGRPAGDQRQRPDPAAGRARGARAGRASCGCRRRPRCRSMKRPTGGWRRSRSSRRSAAGRRAARATTRRCRSAACRSCCRSAPCSTATRRAGIEARIGFRFGDMSYVARLARAARSTSRAATSPAATWSSPATPTRLRRCVYGGAPLDTHRRRGRPRSSRGASSTLFPLPPKAA